MKTPFEPGDRVTYISGIFHPELRVMKVEPGWVHVKHPSGKILTYRPSELRRVGEKGPQAPQEGPKPLFPVATPFPPPSKPLRALLELSEDPLGLLVSFPAGTDRRVTGNRLFRYAAELELMSTEYGAAWHVEPERTDLHRGIVAIRLHTGSIAERAQAARMIRVLIETTRP